MGDEPLRPSGVADLIAACERIVAFTEGCTQPQFYRSALVWSAVAYQIIVLGEAAKRLNTEVRERFSAVPWKDMIGMRDILSHKYETIDLEELWDTVQGDVPRLLATLREIQLALRR
jgi:uncharacterized protein with HEPN domain